MYYGVKNIRQLIRNVDVFFWMIISELQIKTKTELQKGWLDTCKQAAHYQQVLNFFLKKVFLVRLKFTVICEYDLSVNRQNRHILSVSAFCILHLAIPSCYSLSFCFSCISC